MDGAEFAVLCQRRQLILFAMNADFLASPMPVQDGGCMIEIDEGHHDGGAH